MPDVFYSRSVNRFAGHVKPDITVLSVKLSVNKVRLARCDRTEHADNLTWSEFDHYAASSPSSDNGSCTASSVSGVGSFFLGANASFIMSPIPVRVPRRVRTRIRPQTTITNHDCDGSKFPFLATK